MKIEKVTQLIKPYIQRGYILDESYILWDSNKAFIDNEANLIKIQFKKSKNENLSQLKARRLFWKIKRDLDAEVLHIPLRMDLWWEDSLRYLYHHYPHSSDNNSNCVLFTDKWRIVAIQNNWKPNIRNIYCLDIPDRGFIVYNNSKKIEGTYTSQDLPNLLQLWKI